MQQQEQQTRQYTIDAEGRSLGRVATEAARYLMGKDQVDFTRRRAPGVSVAITNASQITLSEKKKRQKTYVRYTGYPSGKREESLGKRLEKKGYEDVFRNAVYGMLPANKLRPIMMKNLYVSE